MRNSKSFVGEEHSELFEENPLRSSKLGGNNDSRFQVTVNDVKNAMFIENYIENAHLEKR